MGHLRDCLLVVGALVLAPSCGGSGEHSKTPDDEPSFGDEAGSDDSALGGDESGGDSGDADKTPASIKTTGAPPPPVPGDFEPSYSDCANLTAVYERLLRSEEMTKLEKKKLPPKVHANALEQIKQVVEDGTSQWRGQCEGIVDTVQIKPRWECAQQADSIKRFHGCMDGEFDDELKK
ncbi:MAG: hypothetical protein JRI23_01830 [Deltaproteobacteria bacterium]|jgi:hypothetical protein|nr:hypothetical protein [Deltaproteobacteria bacterium]MBW2530214.1 hypothetical protein [Deltaproteobacteria bacterium]